MPGAAGAGPGLPPGVRLLQWLVVALTLTMIGGVIAVVALLVTRLPQTARPLPVLPAGVVLPAGARPAAITFGEGWLGVVTDTGRMLVFGPDGALLHEVAVPPPRARP